MISTVVPNTSFKTVTNMIKGYYEITNSIVIPINILFVSDILGKSSRQENINTST